MRRDDAALTVHDTGHALPPVVFQHGLGGDAAQVAQYDPGEARRLTVECRAHGGSEAGSTRPFSIALFADDVLAAADRAGLQRFVAAGISMGAAIALRLAVRHRERVAGLILVRPAWTFEAGPANMAPFREAADLITAHGPDRARDLFGASDTGQFLAREAPDNLASLLGLFDRANARVFADVMAEIAADGPGVSRAEAAGIEVPTLVVGTSHDHVHPLAFARELATVIPAATLCEATPKSLDKNAHFAEVQAAIGEFLQLHFHHRDR